jgi:hypothetical protein
MNDLHERFIVSQLCQLLSLMKLLAENCLFAKIGVLCQVNGFTAMI